MKNILFVCIENSNRSQMAQAFAKIHGNNKVDAYSAGSKPSGKLNPKAVVAMAELRYDLSAHTSKATSEYSNMQFEYVVTMGCGDKCPFIPAIHRLDWDIPDPRNMDTVEFRKVRDLIEIKVKQLVQKIESVKYSI
ncbi:MAG: arsenate reductase ArsC [Leptospirales bacterium]